MGKTVFLSSHILTELADVCTSVAILERGRLVVAGPINDIARRLEEAAMQRQKEQAAHAQVPQQMQQQQMQQPTMQSAGTQTAILPPQPDYRQTEIEPAPQTISVARRRLKVRAFGQLDAVQNALTGVQNIFQITQVTNGLFLVTYSGDDQVIAAIVSALVANKIAVAGVEPERSELERIFLEVTKGEVQ
jgi:ABC-2 type transport system ATP-binding protein